MSNLRPGITALVAAHPARFTNGMLLAALDSVTKQTLQPDTVIIVNDLGRHGAGRTRQKLLSMVQTEWLAWLDSDDYWFSDHLQKLHTVATETDSVFVYSYFDALHDPFTNGGREPQGHFGKPFNPCSPHHTTITFLAKTDIAQRVGFQETQQNGIFSEEDWKHILGFAAYCCENNLKMTHLAEKTWHWRQQGQNSSGKPGQGDAF